jgi:hypothetical protein
MHSLTEQRLHVSRGGHDNLIGGRSPLSFIQDGILSRQNCDGRKNADVDPMQRS